MDYGAEGWHIRAAAMCDEVAARASACEGGSAMVMGLGHVGIICDDLMKMRDFYTRVIGLTITDEDPERGSCFLSANPAYEHHELNLGQARGPDHPDGARPRTQGLGQMSFIVPSLNELRELHRRFQAEGTRILRTVTHGISVSIYFHDPEDNVGEVYYKTGYNVRQGFSRPIDLEKQSDEEILAFSRSFEATIGPFQGARLPVGQAD
jgi:catechol 2,3-dioxygenase-like lactoylglutathione lyase family enzyme